MRCNLRCSFCYNQFQAGAEDTLRSAISIHEAEQLFNKLSGSFEIGTLTLAGGEPTANPNLLSIVTLAKKKCQTLILATNGTLIDEVLAGRLVRAGMDTFQISISGGSADVHDAAVGRPGAFRKMLGGAIAVRRNGGRLALVFIAGDDTRTELPRVLDIAYMLGVEAVIVNEIRGGFDEVSRLSDALILERKHKFCEVLRVAGSLADRYGIPIIVPTYIPPDLKAGLDCFSSIKYKHLKAGVPRIVIDPLGRVRRCQGSSQIIGSLATLSPSVVSTWEGLREDCACALEERRIGPVAMPTT